MNVKEQLRKFLTPSEQKPTSRGWDDRYYSPYYRPEDPKEIARNKQNMEKFLNEPPKPAGLIDKIRSFWQ